MGKKKQNPRLNLYLLYILSFIVSAAPLIVVFAINWGDYTETVAETWKLAIGGMICAVFLAVKAVKNLEHTSILTCFAVIFVLSILMEKVILDLQIISGAALLGEVVERVIFAPIISRQKETIIVKKTANETAKVTKEAIREAVNEALGGRV